MAFENFIVHIRHHLKQKDIYVLMLIFSICAIELLCKRSGFAYKALHATMLYCLDNLKHALELFISFEF